MNSEKQKVNVLNSCPMCVHSVWFNRMWSIGSGTGFATAIKLLQQILFIGEQNCIELTVDNVTAA